MSRFFCDADCELDYRVIDELGITLIQMPYTIGGEEYLFDCGRTTDYATFYGAMRAGAAAKRRHSTITITCSISSRCSLPAKTLST